MNPLRTLRDRIVAEPDDLGLRRVYADALLDRGDVRGQFIHVQLQLAVRQTPELKAAELELLKRNLQHWMLPIRPGRGEVRFVRGFVEEWSCRFDELLRRGKRVVRATPLRRLRVTEVSDNALQHLPRCTPLRLVRELELASLTDWPFDALAEVEFERLEKLKLSGKPWRKGYSLERMTAAPWFGALRELDVQLPVTQEQQLLLRASIDRARA